MKKNLFFISVVFVLGFSFTSIGYSMGVGDQLIEQKDGSKGYLKTKSVLSEGKWFKLGVKETGIYKITGSDLINSGIDLSSVELTKLALYGNATGMVPENNALFWETDLTELALFLHDENNNGFFESEDYILFYAESPNRWIYDAKSNQFSHELHLYSSLNYYFLTIDSKKSTNKQIGTFPHSELVPNQETDISFEHLIHENELKNDLGYGKEWLGEEFSSKQKEFTKTFDVPYAVEDSVLKYNLVAVSNAPLTSSFTILSNMDAQQLYISSSLNETRVYQMNSIKGAFLSYNKNKIPFKLTYHPVSNETGEKGWLKKIELLYWKSLVMTGDQMIFRNPSVIGEGNITQFHLSGINANTWVWDVTNPREVKQMSSQFSNGSLTFIAPTDSLTEYIAFNKNRYYSPVFIQKVENQNLHGLPLTQYLIITSPEFLDEANRLANLHREYSQLHVTVVLIDQVYNEFSSGRKDALAIRRFAKMFYDRVELLPDSLKQNVPHIQYLLLFGDGNYDYKNIKAKGSGSIPPFYRSLHLQAERSKDNTPPCDESFGYLEDNATGSSSNTINLSIGRFPVNINSEAKIMVDKVENYILKKDLNETVKQWDWRNYICLIADDVDKKGDREFEKDLDRLATVLSEQFPDLNVDKIYSDSYKQETSSGEATYPEVNRLINNRMNSGALIVNYMGHGITDHLGVEKFITKNSIAGYSNKYTLPVFITSTCEFGWFDLNSGTSGAEDIVLNPNGGSVAIISAARAIFSDERFNTGLITLSLSFENGKQHTIGDALRIAKNYQKTYNNAATNLLGDPALKISIPQNNIKVTRVNSSEIPVDEMDPNLKDTLKALSEIIVEGEIVDVNNRIITDFSGKVFMVVFDKPREIQTLANDIPGTEFSYLIQKSRIFQGSTNVTNGKFSFTFIVPLSIAYNFDYGKISLYAHNYQNDASGSFNKVIIGGIDENATITGNESRPQIKLFMNDTTFLSGGMTDENPTLVAYLSDEYGINLSDGGEKNRDIEVMLDNNPHAIYNLNDFYEQDTFDIRKGVVRFPFSRLKKGKHTLTLKAWNIYDLSSIVSLDFVVNDANSFETGKVYNFPNPVSSHTQFVCEFNKPLDVKNVEMQLYNINGQKILSLYPNINSGAYSFIYNWDGKDTGGNKISNGVYIYRFVISTLSGDKNVISNKLLIFSK